MRTLCEQVSGRTGASKTTPETWVARGCGAERDRHAGTSKELLNRMKRLPFFSLLLVAASVIPAAGQTSAAPAAQKPSCGRSHRPSQGRGHRLSGSREPDQRIPARLRRPAEEVRPQAPAAEDALSDQIDTLTKQLQDQGPQSSEAERISRARVIDDKKKQLDRDTQDAQSDFQGDMQQLINGVAAKVGAVMTDYAREAGLHAGARRGRPAERNGALRGAPDRHHQGHHRRLQREVGHTGAASRELGREPASA